MRPDPKLPAITIVTPVLNMVGRLPRCIASAYHPACEHLFIDGGSTDGSRGFLLAEGKSVIDAPGSGVYQAQNIGIAHAAGEWCYFLGADDVIFDGAIDKLLPLLVDPSAEYARVRMTYGSQVPRHTPMQQSWVYRRSLLLARTGFTASGLAELVFNREISSLPHVFTDVLMCDVALGGVSERPRKPGEFI